MTSWSQRMAEARQCSMPAANSADRADRLEVGAIGTIGAGLTIWAAHPAVKQSALLALSAQGLVDAVQPCPADVAERATVIADGDHCDRATADARALAEHGFPSWQALADAHRERILGQLDRLPPAPNDHRRRLLRLTPAFLGSVHWTAAVALGWGDSELFGVHETSPRRLDAMGLVPLLAWSLHTVEVAAIDDSGATLRAHLGAKQRYHRFPPGMQAAAPFWECSAPFGRTA